RHILSRLPVKQFAPPAFQRYGRGPAILACLEVDRTLPVSTLAHSCAPCLAGLALREGRQDLPPRLYTSPSSRAGAGVTRRGGRSSRLEHPRSGLTPGPGCGTHDRRGVARRTRRVFGP